MKKSLRLLFILLMAVAALEISGAETITYTLDNTLETALKNNTEIKKYETDLKIAQAQYDQSMGDFWVPSIAFNAGVNLLNPGSVQSSVINMPSIESAKTPPGFNIVSNEITNVFPDNYSMSLGISKPLFAGFRYLNSMDLKKINLEAAGLSLKDKRNDVAARVRILFYSLLFINENISLTAELSRHFLSRFVETISNYSGGYISEFDKISSEVQYKNTIPLLIKLSNTEFEARNALCEEMGLNDPGNAEFLGDFYSLTNIIDKEVTLENAISNTMSNNITLKTLDISIEMGKLSLKVAESSRWPILSAFFNYTYDYKKQNYLDTERQWLPGWNTGLQFVMPIDDLFPVSKTANAIKEAGDNIEKLEWIKKQVSDSIFYQIRNLYDEERNGEKIVISQRDIMNKALDGYDMAQKRYKIWASPVAEVNGMEMLYYQADIAYLQSIMDEYTNSVLLHRMID